MFSFPSWVPPKASSDLGNIRNDDISREISVVVHSEGKEARKLEYLQSSKAVFDKNSCTTTNVSLLMSPFLLFPRFDEALGGTQEGRGNNG